MSDNKEYMTHLEEGGSINISEDVVAAIAVSAAREVEGVAGMMSTSAGNVSELMKKGLAKGVKLDVTEDAITLELYLNVSYGHAIPEVAENVQKAVSSAVEAMTGFSVSTVNVHVTGISL
ncbi:Asp23/Gls24 family envelope stress response protein [Oscillibacter hominis]|uniref:Asp23/Gls24 family envelope stress response protein n=1 Tax=Oscillibacter hominis TaxID=2763056 RepID=A0A7G9B7K4_9FIRM|nr:Asp23/Gls24 family envelope stress response protein [Oscillibacter hominis]QNL45535.1 Asp23/Gls24 family envelope stress response protein [Oscillibacter hominis]